MKALNINQVYTFLTLTLAIFSVAKVSADYTDIPATVVDVFVLVDNLGILSQTGYYDFNRMISDIVVSFVRYGDSYNVTIGVGAHHDIAHPEFKIVMDMIPIDAYEDTIDFNEEVMGDGQGFPANASSLKYGYDENYVKWRGDAMKFLLWVGDLTNLNVGVEEVEGHIDGLKNASVQVIAVNTGDDPVDGTTNLIVTETLGKIYYSPNDDLDLPQFVEDTIDYYNELANMKSEEGYDEVAIGSIISCQKSKLGKYHDAMGSVISPASMDSIIAIEKDEDYFIEDELDEFDDILG